MKKSDKVQFFIVAFTNSLHIRRCNRIKKSIASNSNRLMFVFIASWHRSSRSSNFIFMRRINIRALNAMDNALKSSENENYTDGIEWKN